MQSLKKIHAWAQMKVPLCKQNMTSLSLLAGRTVKSQPQVFTTNTPANINLRPLSVHQQNAISMAFADGPTEAPVTRVCQQTLFGTSQNIGNKNKMRRIPLGTFFYRYKM